MKVYYRHGIPAADGVYQTEDGIQFTVVDGVIQSHQMEVCDLCACDRILHKDKIVELMCDPFIQSNGFPGIFRRYYDTLTFTNGKSIKLDPHAKVEVLI